VASQRNALYQYAKGENTMIESDQLICKIRAHLLDLPVEYLRWLLAFCECPEEYRHLFFKETLEGGLVAAIAFAETRYGAKG